MNMQTVKHYLLKYKIFLALGVLLTTIPFLLMLFSDNTTPPPSTITLTPTPILAHPEDQPFSPKTIPGTTTENELSSLAGVEKITDTDFGPLYGYNSVLTDHPNLIQVENDKVVREKIVTLHENSKAATTKLADLKRQYGPAEEEIKGSKYYGEYLTTYVYARKGFSFIANPYTGEVLEIQYFIPVSLEEFKERFGDDLPDSNEVENHGHERPGTFPQ